MDWTRPKGDRQVADRRSEKRLASAARPRPSRARMPSGEVAAYAQEHVTCRTCGATPGARCVEQAERWRTVCKARFADAASAYADIWRDAHPASPQIRLVGVTRPEVPVPDSDECPF